MSWGRVKIDPADRYCSQYVRLRDKECLRCHSPVRLNDKGLPVSHQASHFVGRSKENTRFMLSNLSTLCGGCHQYFTSHPAEHYEWQVKRLGQETVDNLKLAGNTYCRKDRKSEALYWRQKLKELQD